MLTSKLVWVLFMVVCVCFIRITSSANCPAPPVVSNANVTYDVAYANYTCIGGHNMTSGDGRLECLTGDMWSADVPICSVIHCGVPGEISAMWSDYAGDDVYGAVVTLLCPSGHAGSGYAVTCSNNTTWVPDGVSTCERRSDYVGCFADWGVPYLPTTVDDIHECREHCRQQNVKYAGIVGGACQCRDDANTVLLSDVTCDVNCPGAVADKCGGSNNTLSVFFSFSLVYDLSTPGVLPFVYIRQNRLALCIQYCRGLDMPYIATRSLIDCSCLSGIDVNAALVSNAATGTYEIQPTSGYFPDDDFYSSCEALFLEGALIHGDYYIRDDQGTVTKTYCHFLDGTICDADWIGLNGNCYNFDSTPYPSFDAAQTQCRSLDAEVVTIHSETEMSFLSYRLYNFSDTTNVGAWYIGLYDYLGTHAFTWTDGTLMNFSYFNPDEPSTSNRPCTVISRDSYKWTTVNCATAASVLCQKTGFTMCIELNTSSAANQVTSATMTATYCLEYCSGQNYYYAGVRNTECSCYDVADVQVDSSPMTSCNISCPGNLYQQCGGQAVGVEYSTFLNGTLKPVALSCTDLYLQGIDNIDAVIFVNNNVIIKNCPDENLCPPQFVHHNGSCYKFMAGQMSLSSSINHCHVYGAYVVSINSVQELDFVLTTINTTAIMNTRQTFAVGLHSSTGTNLYRWFNGATMTLPLTASVNNKCGALFPTEGALDVNDCGSQNPFICEKGSDYVGEHVLPPGAQKVIDNFPEVNVNLCMEVCKGMTLRYAMISNKDCYCGNLLPAPSTLNVTRCLKDEFQLCGSTGGVSAYDTDLFETVAETCSDLYDRGIHIAGNYTLTGGNEFCTFYDDTNCSPSWIGANGSCYRLAVQTTSVEGARDNCHAGSMSAFLLSINSAAEFDVIVRGVRGLVGTSRKEIYIGAYDALGMLTHAWADGSLRKADWWSSESAYETTGQCAQLDEYNVQDYEYKIDNCTDEHVYVCERPSMRQCARYHLAFTSELFTSLTPLVISLQKPDGIGHNVAPLTNFVGCYSKGETSPMATILANHPSMTVTLCKQLCLGSGYSQAGIGNVDCFCGTSGVMSGLAPASADNACNTLCNGNALQYCGGAGSKISLFDIDNSDAPNTCSDLYMNGIFHTAAYQLANVSCGFTDNTVCPIGYLGKDGSCYEFVAEKKTMLEATSYCQARGSIVSIPNTESSFQFLNDIISNTPLASFGFPWQVGAGDLYYNGQYVTSDGRILNGQSTCSPSTSGHRCSKINGNCWAQTNCVDSPFVCEIFPAYKGCFDYTAFSSIPVSLVDESSMSVTQCIEFCRSGAHPYVGLLLNNCYCIDDAQLPPPDSIVCEHPCTGNPFQLCGSQTNGRIAVYNMDYYSNYFAKSCEQLRQVGVFYPGPYRIKPENATEYVTVNCFETVSMYGVLDDVTRSASTSLDNFTASNSALTNVIFELDGWRPLVTSGQEWLQIDLFDEDLVTGMQVQGRGAPGDWSVTCTLDYSSDGSLWEASSEEISIHRGVMMRLLFDSPFVARHLRLYLRDWSGEIGVQVAPLGKVYGSVTAIDKTDRNIGCFADFEPSGFDISYPYTTDENCHEQCRFSGYPIYGIKAIGSGENCKCGNDFGKYGKLTEDACAGTTVLSYAVSVFRTFEYKCIDALPFVGNAQLTIVSEGLEARYDCVTDHHFSNMSSAMTSYCQPDLTWGPVETECLYDYAGQVIYHRMSDITLGSRGKKVVGAIETHTASSVLECAAQCITDYVYSCNAINFRKVNTPPGAENNCEIYFGPTTLYTVDDTNDWGYYIFGPLEVKYM